MTAFSNPQPNRPEAVEQSAKTLQDIIDEDSARATGTARQLQTQQQQVSQSQSSLDSENDVAQQTSDAPAAPAVSVDTVIDYVPLDAGEVVILGQMYLDRYTGYEGVATAVAEEIGGIHKAWIETIGVDGSPHGAWLITSRLMRCVTAQQESGAEGS